MKSILLTTTAIVAFAGAAAADGHSNIGFGGEATLGYNDDVENGFYWDSEIDVTMSAALDNGLTASATFGLNVVDNSLGDPVLTSDYVLELASETAALRFGDLDPVAEDNWGGVDGDSTAGFNDQDVHLAEVDPNGIPDDGDEYTLFDAMLVGEVTAGGVTAMLSYGVKNGANIVGDEIGALQVYATGDFGMFGIEAAYQEAYAGTDEVIGVAGNAAVAGADVTVAYIADDTETSIGVGAAYPFGPVTVAGYYSFNDIAEDSYGVSADYVDGPIAVNAFYDFTGNTGAADEVNEFGVEGSYDVGNGFMALAGYISTDDASAPDTTAAYYVAGTYDLGGGAELLVSYAEDEANATNDEIGDPEYLHGTTVAVSFAF